jgi:hypothetical protein
MRFRLANQTSQSIFFSGGASFADLYPFATKIECWDSHTGEWKEAHFELSAMYWDEIEVSPGEQVFVAVSRERPEGKNGPLPGTRCKLLLQLKDRTTPGVYSNEFEF